MSVRQYLLDHLNNPGFIQGFTTFIKRYLVWWFYGMAIIEILALALKAIGINVPLVSKVARDTAFNGLPTLAYFMAGMSAHWFVTWRYYPWDGWVKTFLAALFWAVGLAYYMADKLDPVHTYWPVWAQWLRYPPVVALVGFVLALVCFPQNSSWFPGFSRIVNSIIR